MDWLGDEVTDAATQAILYGTSTVIQIIIQVATMIIISRSLGPANYGVYTLALLPSTILTIFSDPGITSSMLRYISIARARKELKGVARAYRVSILFLTLINTLILAVIALFPEELGVQLAQRSGLRELVLVTAPYPLATAIYGAVLTYYASMEKAGVRSMLQVLAPLLRLMLVSIVLLLGLSVKGVIVAHVTTYIVMAIVSLLISFKELKGLSSNGSIFKVSEFLTLAFSIYLTGIAGAIVGRIISFLIAYTTSNLGETGNYMVGNYNAASAFLGAIASILGSLATPLTPLLAKKLNNGGLKETSNLVLNVLLTLTIPVTVYVVLFADSIIYSVYGRNYSTAPLFFAYMSISLLAWPLQTVYGSIYWVYNDKKPLAGYGLALMATGTVFSIVLSDIMGLQGIALAQGLYPLLSSMVLAYYGYFKHGVKPSISKASILLALSLTTGVFSKYIAGWIQFYIIQALLGFILYLVLFTLCSGFFNIIEEIEIGFLDLLARRIPLIGPVLRLLLKLYRRLTSATRV